MNPALSTSPIHRLQHIEFAKQETIDRIEETEIDLRRDIRKSEKDLKDS